MYRVRAGSPSMNRTWWRRYRAKKTISSRAAASSGFNWEKKAMFCSIGWTGRATVTPPSSAGGAVLLPFAGRIPSSFATALAESFQFVQQRFEHVHDAQNELGTGHVHPGVFQKVEGIVRTALAKHRQVTLHGGSTLFQNGLAQ